MSQPLAYYNGEFIGADELSIPVYDMGFVQGVAVSEQLRTFQGTLFRLEHHLQRLTRSLQITGLSEQVDTDALAGVAKELVARNHALLNQGDDLGLSLFITPGPYPTFAPAGAAGPTIGMHTYALPFRQWAHFYEAGQHLVVSNARQVPHQCWPAELKCRSRMHYYLADREAAHREPGSRALLLDLEDRVIEASTANIIAFNRDQGLSSPPRETILPGVSMAVIEELAGKLEIPFQHRSLTVAALADADEVLLSSTSPCVWPVVQLDGEPIHDGQPGPIFRRLLAAWSELVGVDIRGQAEQFAAR